MPNRKLAALPDLSDPDRLAARLIKRTHTPTGFFGCWEFTGCIAKKLGYGNIGCKTVDGKNAIFLTHRLAFMLAYGPEVLADGRHIHHECHNRKCWNPMHLSALDRDEHGFAHRLEVCRKGHPRSGANLKKHGKYPECRQCDVERRRTQSTFHRGPWKTECKNGHPWIPENIFTAKNGQHGCKICKRLWDAAYYKRKAARERGVDGARAAHLGGAGR